MAKQTKNFMPAKSRTCCNSIEFSVILDWKWPGQWWKMAFQRISINCLKHFLGSMPQTSLRACTFSVDSELATPMALVAYFENPASASKLSDHPVMTAFPTAFWHKLLILKSWVEWVGWFFPPIQIFFPSILVLPSGLNLADCNLS